MTGNTSTPLQGNSEKRQLLFFTFDFSLLTFSLTFVAHLSAMKRQIVFRRIASAGYIVLGLLHVLVERFDTADNNAAVFGAMRSFLPSAFEGSGVTLFDFYKGYSFMMGMLAIAFGAHGFMLSRDPDNRRHWVTLLLSAGAFAIAVTHFPPLVWCFILVCTLCYGIALLPGASSGKQH